MNLQEVARGIRRARAIQDHRSPSKPERRPHSLNTTTTVLESTQGILESPTPRGRQPADSRLDRRTPPDRWVIQRPSSGRWAIRAGKAPKGSYATQAAAVAVVVKRREARDKLKEVQRARKEHREAVKAAKLAVRAQRALERREAFEVKKAAQVAKGRADAVKLNETITNRIKRQRETARRNGI
jgi:hypothetical protein